MNAAPDPPARFNPAAWRWYAAFYRGHYPVLLASLLVALAQAALLLPIGGLVGRLFDSIIPRADLAGLVRSCLLILLLYLANGGLALGTRFVVLRTTKSAIQQLRAGLLAKLYALPRSYHDEVEISHLHNVVVQDSERLDVMSNALLAQTLPAGLISAVLLGVLAVLNLRLLLVAASILPVLWFLSRALGQRVQIWVHAFRQAFEEFSRGVLFVLNQLDLTRAQAAEAAEQARQLGKLDHLRRVSGSMAWLMSAYGFVQSTVATAAGGLVLAAGGALVAGGAMTLGALIAFYVVLGLLQGQAGLIFNTVPQVIAGAEALLGLYQLQHEPAGPPYTGGECITLRGEITLQAVAFHYRRQAVLHGVDLALRPGEVTAIVGPNGAGKSTLVNLMLGFYRPQAGALLADGVPYDRLDLPHLRRQIGVVMQEALLFPGTVWDNLTYGFEDAAPETVERAAEWAAASELLRSLPEGYATPVGEHGVLLSGGQRQRLAIARALLREPRLLILDEPTNHLDAATVDTVMGNLRRLPQRPAILLISHDPGVVRGADRVYHLREGRLAPAEG